ncbi:MAG: porin [Psychrobium sp.]
MKNVKLKTALLPLVIAMPVFQASADDNVSKAQLEKQLEVISKRIAALEGTETKSDSKTSFNVYGTLRPTFGVTSGDSEDSWDVGDALSRVGFATSRELGNGMTAFAKGEFKVNIQLNGDFGEARKAYVGIKGDFGRIAIGKQATMQYNIIADPVDIFNRASTPLAYDDASPFRQQQLVSYGKDFGNLSFSIAGQFNKDTDNEGSDLVNAGLKYKGDGFTLGAAYLTRDFAGTDENTLGLSASKNIGDHYIAASYQDIDRGGNGQDRSTIDVVGAFKISDSYKFKLGLSNYADDLSAFDTAEVTRINTTLEWHASSDFYTFIEYQNNNFKEREDNDQVMIGMRYNFDYKF